MDAERESRCPFPLAILLYASAVIVLPISAVLFRIQLSLTWSYLLLLGGVVACAVYLESRRRAGDDCSWLEVGVARRLLLYGALAFIGLLLFLPLGSMEIDVGLLPIWGVLAALAVIPTAALLGVHVRVDHSVLEQVGVPWWLFVASRLPLYLLLLLGLAAVVLAGLTIIFGPPGR
jgi:hypothetical protein